MTTVLTALTEWHWFGIAVLLGILEVAVGASFFLLWLAISAVTVAVVLLLWPELCWQQQLLIFALEAIACMLLWWLHLKNRPAKTDNPTLNRRSQQYINRVFVLVEPIVNGRGKIQVDDSFWVVSGPDLACGQRVRVVDATGVVLTVVAEVTKV